MQFHGPVMACFSAPSIAVLENFAFSEATSYLDWLVGCFGFNSPLRQYFSLYQTVSQREGDRGEKG